MRRNYLEARVMVAIQKVAECRARRYLARQPGLWADLQDYLGRTVSTGCNLYDYWQLHRRIRRLKPVEVLECGTGVTTLVIAHALLMNERETGRRGRITSMEEIETYLEMARQLLPEYYRPVVEFVFSPTVDDYFSAFRGVRYRDLPDRPYDFVFVDGPSYKSRLDGTPTSDFDFLHVLLRSDRPVAGLVDTRTSTCFVLQQVLAPARSATRRRSAWASSRPARDATWGSSPTSSPRPPLRGASVSSAPLASPCTP